MKKENNNTFSIFDSVLEEVTADASPKIDVVNLTFESAVSMNWTELFPILDRAFDAEQCRKYLH